MFRSVLFFMLLGAKSLFANPIELPQKGDGKAILRRILDVPADNAARLVFADWLEEHGAPKWAEFIRMQIDLYNKGETPNLTHKSLFEATKAETRGATIAFIPDGLVSLNLTIDHFERGFPAKIIIDPENSPLPSLPKVVQEGWSTVEGLHFEKTSGGQLQEYIASITRMPWAKKIRKLSFSERAPNDLVMRELAQLPEVKILRIDGHYAPTFIPGTATPSESALSTVLVFFDRTKSKIEEFSIRLGIIRAADSFFIDLQQLLIRQSFSNLRSLKIQVRRRGVLVPSDLYTLRGVVLPKSVEQFNFWLFDVHTEDKASADQVFSVFEEFNKKLKIKSATIEAFSGDEQAEPHVARDLGEVFFWQDGQIKRRNRLPCERISWFKGPSF